MEAICSSPGEVGEKIILERHSKEDWERNWIIIIFKME